MESALGKIYEHQVGGGSQVRWFDLSIVGPEEVVLARRAAKKSGLLRQPVKPILSNYFWFYGANLLAPTSDCKSPTL